MEEKFHRFAAHCSEISGKWYSFLCAVILILVWLITGPILHFSEAWQLTINTGTTIITFLMVFVIQNTQNIQDHAMHKKLDELIRVNQKASNDLIQIEERG